MAVHLMSSQYNQVSPALPGLHKWPPTQYKLQSAIVSNDTVVYLSLTSANESVILQQDRKLLEKWKLEWDMEFNTSKCHVIHVTKRKHISNNLTWDEHINRSTKNANRTLGFLHRNIKVKSEPIKSIAYQTPVRSQLKYASEIWSSPDTNRPSRKHYTPSVTNMC